MSAAATVQEYDALSKMIELLHKDDNAVRLHFGVDRQALLEKYRCFMSGCIEEGSAGESIEIKIKKMVSLPLEGASGQVVFGRFYARCYVYLKYVFEHHLEHNSICEWIDMDSFLPSIRSHVTLLIKSLAEKSLVHHLNSRIADGADLDPETVDQELAGVGLAQFLASYPVLARLLIERIEDTVAYLYKILNCFAEDFQQLNSTFSISSRRVGAISLGLGDAHANGETVCCVQIGNQELIFKPRSNREALFYGAVLEQLRTQTGNSCFAVHAPLMVSLEEHCWIEKIENVPCETESELLLFFQRFGAQVAVIHALNGIDFHYENIIAYGSSPVMIDLECLFTPAMVDLKVDVPHGRALFKIIKLNSQSVFTTGVVPNSAGSGDDQSGLSRQQQFVAIRKLLVLEDGFYRLKSNEVNNRPLMRHLPIFGGEAYSVTDYQHAFFYGFELGYDEVVNRRDAILELLERHAEGLKSRVLIKNTQRYTDFIAMMTHPRFTQCQLKFELLLATLWSDVGDTLNELDIPRHEINDLKKANFPRFTQSLLSDQLLNAQGRTVALLPIERPFESCRRKLEMLSPKDKAFQIHILQACLLPGARESLNRSHQLVAVPELDRAQFLDGAMRIAGIIEKNRIEGEEGDVGWTFMDTHPQTKRNFITYMGNSLYNGMGGLAIFYLSLFRVSGATRHRDEAERILYSISQCQDHFPNKLAVSAYFGLTSYLYVLVNYELMTGRQTYQSTVEELLRKLADFPREDDEFDFILGWCGVLTILVNLYQLEKRETLLPLIEKFSQAIQSALTLDNEFLRLKATGKPLWTGFSHGISGVLLAMGKAWEATKAPLLAELITKWLQAENRLTVDGFWLDLRENTPSAVSMKWCHGDGGILLSRRWLTQSMNGALNAETRSVLEQDAERCERHLWEQGLGSGYSLCHGDFGNLMCLLKLYRETNNKQGIARVNRALSQVAHNFFNEDFLDERNIPDLGMMLGITGVGQALLQAVDAGLPDVLSLEFARPIQPERPKAE
ncbi:type 2 lanthipeptide synthetase LanM [Pseudomonas sp. C2B4]|uniref:type 2 lanthipeptide synthetase LanM n=1 Tax=Pseudomonas sp. C2B4 TaxID=2735270 RepID=UPI001585FC6B|nr:type 2 lanthipeptide synthetase LanM [Pseudomonas sp. C2B4]NUU38626.1 type 2 lantipeptide synthetase LanM [Pseudomonas sp. C2B4]